MMLYLKDKETTLALMKKACAGACPEIPLRAGKAGHADRAARHCNLAAPERAATVSVNTEPGLAKRTLALCKEAGVVMTGAGATFPYGIDPQDSNIRIAPSLPPGS